MHKKLKTLSLRAGVIPARLLQSRARPAGYVEAGTEIKISVRLAAPLPECPRGAFARMVVFCRYVRARRNVWFFGVVIGRWSLSFLVIADFCGLSVPVVMTIRV